MHVSKQQVDRGMRQILAEHIVEAKEQGLAFDGTQDPDAFGANVRAVFGHLAEPIIVWTSGTGDQFRALRKAIPGAFVIVVDGSAPPLLFNNMQDMKAKWENVTGLFSQRLILRIGPRVTGAPTGAPS